jgi:hypothetical protein
MVLESHIIEELGTYEQLMIVEINCIGYILG